MSILSEESLLRRLIVALLACLGVLFILLIVLTGGFGYWAVHRLGAPGEARLPARMVLTLDLRQPLTEAAGSRPSTFWATAPRSR